MIEKILTNPMTISMGAALIVGLFAKYCPKGKIVGWLKPKMYGLGELVSKTLILRIGRKAAEKVEEGILVTITTAISESIGGFVDGLLADNENKKSKGKG